MARRRKLRTIGALLCFALAGCGAVLGIDDIERDPVDGGVAPPPSSGPDASDAAPPKRCAADAPLLPPQMLAELSGPAGVGGEQYPRITRDELTIVFMRLVPGDGGQNVATWFTARRSSRTGTFDTPQQLTTTAGGAPQFAAITADGGRFFFSQGQGGNRVLRAAAFSPDGVLTPKSINGVGDDKDVVFPFPLEQTQEVFFTRAPVSQSQIFAIYRTTGAGDSFGFASRVDSIETLPVEPGHVTTYEEPVLNDDGTRLYFSSRSVDASGPTPILGPSSVYVATRTDTIHAVFANPVALPDLSQLMRQGGIGGMSPDECTLYTYRQSDDNRSRLFVVERKRD